MRPLNFPYVRSVQACLALIFLSSTALADPTHGIAMYGDPALPPDFVSLPYANANAPKGGRLVEGNTGGFDSLNPFIRKGTVPWQLRFLAYESLLTRSMDEPFTLYGLLAESVEVPQDRSWVEFTLNPQARFSDGSPVTVEDVIWSYETLGTQGHPRYLGFQQKVDRIEQTGPRSLRITFNTPDRELPLIAGLRPILKKAQWDGRDFTATTIHDVPIGSAPYVVSDYEQGRSVTLTRNPDYWGNDLPIRRGTNNLNEIRLEFFGDNSVLFEAFKSGTLTLYRETNAETWATQYDFPAVSRGDVVKAEIQHQRPTGMTGYVMNTRRAPFDDWRVRQAMLLAFNFPYINDTITGGRQARITSYFANSELGLRPGPATGRVAELLAPYADTLPPGTLQDYDLPAGDTSPRNRKDLRRAVALLEQAGWTVQDGTLVNAAGQPFTFEVLLRQGDGVGQAVFDIYRPALERLGIAMTINTVDNAQYAARETAFDFDVMPFRRDLSLSPGNEQKLYWGAEGAERPGSRNLMGITSPAADAMIDAMLTATDRTDFIAAARALDRVLMAGRYVIPIWRFGPDRIAHAKQLKYPEHIPIYGGRNGWIPDVWWYEE
ncbi:peptide/nickel transport system substrate-binding protein [Thalassovita litoralis]|uniref:Peptide/nickel transport system substrate-binding protein n=1 Tax=Thalassovita litoralis TaxID=1010611 RepID=A0A521E276_9RHOB|nr:extracellular solute-binding protein [Thalassovita litoralis]SMO78064.1 peptide/nickel transport system substrate-binding protein [Thalassovita litoralis]